MTDILISGRRPALIVAFFAACYLIGSGLALNFSMVMQ